MGYRFGSAFQWVSVSHCRFLVSTSVLQCCDILYCGPFSLNFGSHLLLADLCRGLHLFFPSLNLFMTDFHFALVDLHFFSSGLRFFSNGLELLCSASALASKSLWRVFVWPCILVSYRFSSRR